MKMKTIKGLTLALAFAAVVGAVQTQPVAVELARTALGLAGALADTKSTLESLDAKAPTLSESQNEAVRALRIQLAGFQEYVAGHEFKLTKEEKKDLIRGIEAYEDRLYAVRDKILQDWSSRPGEPHGCLAATDLAYHRADFELDRFGSVFAKHNWKPDRPNDLAARFIAVMRAYGYLLTTFSDDPDYKRMELLLKRTLPNQPPLQTPSSVTPAASAPVAPPPGAAGR
jgi:hypothetical protein